MAQDPKDLYRQTLLRHSEETRNEGAMDDTTHQATLSNTLCGDEITIYLSVSEDTIKDACYVTQSCAICRASSSMMTQAIKGKSIDEAKKIAQEVCEAVKNEERPMPIEVLEDLGALKGVFPYPARWRCATLPWEAFEQALDATSPDT